MVRFMANDIPVKCRCGELRGAVLGATRGSGNRAICYCLDCQAFARFLGTDGILDAHGGSDIFQMMPADLRIDSGAKNIACVRLSPKGMLRWYAACCKTPIGNGSPSARTPFIGVVQPFMDHEADGRTRDEAVGPPRVRVNTKSAIDGVPPGANGKISFSAAVHFIGLLGGGFLRGKNRPTPFFGADGQPIVKPMILEPHVHEALRHASPAST